MNKEFCCRIVTILSFILAIAAGQAAAEDPHFMSTYQSEFGLKLYHDGKIDFAIEKFVRALLLDPENKTAKDTLKKIGEEIYPSSDSRVYKIARFIDQIEYYTFLDIRYRGLTEENSRLSDFLKKKQEKFTGEFSEKVKSLQEFQDKRAVVTPSIGVIGFSGDQGDIFDLEKVTSKLSEERQSLLKEIAFWESQNTQLRALRKTVLEREAVETVSAKNYKTELNEIQGRVEQKDNLLATQNQNLEYFKQELAQVRDNFNVLQDRFKSTDQKINELTGKIADLSMVIIEKNKIIDEKSDAAQLLQRQVSEAGEKLNLVQRIIQEKDDRIAALESEMTQVRGNLKSNDNLDGSQVAQLKSDLKDFEGQFKSQMEKSRERIIGLEIQFMDMTRKYDVLSADILSKEAQIATLRIESKKKEDFIKQYRSAFYATDHKANELVGIVDIYRSKLAETKQQLTAKEAELRLLKGESITPDENLPAPKAPDQTHQALTDMNLTFTKADAH